MCLKKCRHVFKILDIKIFIKNVDDVTKTHLISIKNVSSVHKFVHKMWYNILEKLRRFLQQIFVRFFTKNLILGFEKWKMNMPEFFFFTRSGSKTFYTQPFGQLYIKYGLVLQNFDRSNFTTNLPYVLHKKKPLNLGTKMEN